jgi:alpha-1,2-glucosyltransferase
MNISTIPGYHYAMWALACLTGHSSIQDIRLFNTVFGFLCVLVFAMCAVKIHGVLRLDRILQFTFLPILFPFFFMVYADAFSLLLVLLSFYTALSGRMAISGLICCAGVLVRQNNMVWLAAIPAIMYAREYGYAFSLEKTAGMLRRCWTFLLGIAASAIFVLLNHGFAVGDAASHPPFRLHTGNVFFMLSVFFIVFFPQVVFSLPRMAGLLRTGWRTLLWLAPVFLLYLPTFVNTHPYNTRWGECFLRNRALIYFTSSLPLKALFFIPVALAIMAVSVAPLKERAYRLAYLFSVIYLLPSWLIEQRYYIIPFSLFLLFREQGSKTQEIAALLWSILLSAFFVFGIRNGLFFL